MTRLTGGCQCGAVRFAVEETGLGQASVCHCRMCQRAFGSFYAPLVAVHPDALTWTRGERGLYRSSNHVSRGFCAACGTPLTYEADGDDPALAIGAFDRPELIAPTIQFGVERKLPYVDGVPALPERVTLDPADPATSVYQDIVSYQHPDHDTAAWPPEDPRT